MIEREQKRLPPREAQNGRLDGASTEISIQAGAANVKPFALFLHNGGNHPATKESGLKPTSFTTEAVITALDDLARATAQAHTAARFTDGKRCDKNFEAADCAMFDIDGGDWKGEAGAERIRSELNGLRFMAASSASGAWHIFFPLSRRIKLDVDAYRKLKRRIAAHYPFFDKNAVDASRFFFANPDAAVFEAEGDFVDEAAAAWAEPEVAPPAATLPRATDLDPRWEAGVMPDGSRTEGLPALANFAANHGRSLDELLAVVARNWPEGGAKLDNTLKQARNLYAGSMATSTRATAPVLLNDPANRNLPTRLDDFTNARLGEFLISEAHGEIIFTEGRGWLRFNPDDGTMTAGAEAALRRRIAQIGQVLKARAGTFEDNDEAKRWFALGCRLQETRTISATVKAAEAYALRDDNLLDADPAALNCRGELYNLRDGTHRPTRASDLCTKTTCCRPAEGTPEVFSSALLDWAQGKPGLYEYLLRFAGYCLTGEFIEEVFLNLHGPAQNGKSKFLEAIQKILGTYAVALPREIILETRNGNTQTAAAMLAGARLAVHADVGEGRLNIGAIKSLTGGDIIEARELYCKRFSFQNRAKIVFSTNRPLRLVDTGAAIRRRLRVAPFTNTIPSDKRDKRLAEKIAAEYPQILLLLISEAVAWYKSGLPDCATVESASAAYVDSEDRALQFITDRLGNATIGTREAFDNYRDWAQEQGFTHLWTQSKLAEELEAHGWVKKRIKMAGSFSNYFIPPKGGADETEPE
ncbi:MAG: putative DNA primase/helicase [Treponematales bacterium]